MEWCDDGLVDSIAAAAFMQRDPSTWTCVVHPMRPAYRKKHMLCQSCYREHLKHKKGNDGISIPREKVPCPMCGKMTRHTRRGCCLKCYEHHPQRRSKPP